MFEGSVFVFEGKVLGGDGNNALICFFPLPLSCKEDERLEEEFFSQLLPHRFERLEDTTQLPIEISHCVLAGLHRNPEALFD